jgi:hypothetical protein
VKHDNSVGHDEAMPIIPVSSHCGFGVIAVEEQKVDRHLPVLRRIGAELFDPNYAPIAGTVNEVVSGALRGINEVSSAQVEWVNQP